MTKENDKCHDDEPKTPKDPEAPDPEPLEGDTDPGGGVPDNPGKGGG